jgi:hypothetical protein
LECDVVTSLLCVAVRHDGYILRRVATRRPKRRHDAALQISEIDILSSTLDILFVCRRISAPGLSPGLSPIRSVILLNILPAPIY